LKNLQKNHVTLIRTYRVGEIPDIEIDFKDLLQPLMALVKRDSTIATEIMLELFTQIYKNSQAESRKKLGAGIKGILQQSIKFDYGIINTTHRIAIELQKIDGFDLDPEVVERTGRSSMSFQTSLLLLEESILKSEDLHLQIPKKSEKSIREPIANGFG
jgi:DNA-dependent protein kinase catalytic subunit